MIKKYLLWFLTVLIWLVSFWYWYEYVDCSTDLWSSQCIKLDPFETLNMSNYQVSFNWSNINFYDLIQWHNFSWIYWKRWYWWTLYTITRWIFKDWQYINIIYSDKQLTWYYAFSWFTCIADDYRDCMYSSSSYFSIYHVNDLSEFSWHNYDYVILPYSTMSSFLADWYWICLHFPVWDKYLCFWLHWWFSYWYLPEWVQYQTIWWNTYFNTQSDPFPYFPWVWINTWSSVTWDTVWMTWDLMYNECTNWYVLSRIRWVYWFNSVWKHICLAWTFDTWAIQSNSWTVLANYSTWLTLRELVNLTKLDSESYEDRFNWYANEIYRFRKSNIVNPFIGRPVALFTYFNNLYDNWYIYPNQNEAYFIANYCNLLLYSDYNAQYNWNYFQEYCDIKLDSNWNIITTWEVWSIDDWEILPPWFEVTNTWSIAWLSRNWLLSWDVNSDFDWMSFINKFYQELSTRFEKPNWNLFWIVPNYILVFMFALILFRFLSH